MSKLGMILLGMFLQGICDFFSMIIGYIQESEEIAKLKYFHTYNRLLIVVCVIYYFVLLFKNTELLYIATIVCYGYGLICMPFHQYCFVKYYSMEKEKQSNGE